MGLGQGHITRLRETLFKGPLKVPGNIRTPESLYLKTTNSEKGNHNGSILSSKNKCQIFISRIVEISYGLLPATARGERSFHSLGEVDEHVMSLRCVFEQGTRSSRPTSDHKGLCRRRSCILFTSISAILVYQPLQSGRYNWYFITFAKRSAGDSQGYKLG